MEHTTNNNNITTKLDDKPENELERDLMEELDINKYLVYKKPEEDGPEIRGGLIDPLIIQATKATKNGGKFLINFIIFLLVSLIINRFIY